MSDRPEDIPETVWDAAWETLHPVMREGYETSPLAFVQHLGIAKAILKAREEAFEECREVMEFYAKAWVDEFGFLASEPRGKEPNDALYDDEGQRARDLLAKLDAIRQHSQKGER